MALALGCSPLIAAPYGEHEIRFGGDAPLPLGLIPSDTDVIDAVAWLMSTKLGLRFPAGTKVYIFVNEATLVDGLIQIAGEKREAAWEKGRDEGGVFLGVDAQDFVGDARRFVKRFGLTYPQVHDGSGSTLGRFGVTGFPETWFVDREGKLVGERVQGPISAEQLDRNIEIALGGGEAALGAAGGGDR